MRISDWSSDVCSSDLFQIHPFLGERVLDALVLADRPVEDDAFPGILGRAAQRIAAAPDRLGADAHAFGDAAVEDIGAALAFLADPVLFGNEQAVDNNLVPIPRIAATLGDGEAGHHGQYET